MTEERAQELAVSFVDNLECALNHATLGYFGKQDLISSLAEILLEVSK